MKPSSAVSGEFGDALDPRGGQRRDPLVECVAFRVVDQRGVQCRRDLRHAAQRRQQRCPALPQRRAAPLVRLVEPEPLQARGGAHLDQPRPAGPSQLIRQH